jgi:CRISPR-associated protein Csd1
MPGYAVKDEKWLAEIMSGINGSFPSHMMMDDQAKFAIGYYHQKQAFYVSTKDQSANSEGEKK